MVSHLLDVNALIALLRKDHQFHDTMTGCFSRQARAGWATCAITQSEFVRVMSQPALAKHGHTLAELADLLTHNTARPSHRLLALDFDFTEVLTCCIGGVVGHRQVTDGYLPTAAVRAGMKLLTFDQGIAQLLATDAEALIVALVLRRGRLDGDEVGAADAVVLPHDQGHHLRTQGTRRAGGGRGARGRKRRARLDRALQRSWPYPDRGAFLNSTRRLPFAPTRNAMSFPRSSVRRRSEEWPTTRQGRASWQPSHFQIVLQAHHVQRQRTEKSLRCCQARPR